MLTTLDKLLFYFHVEASAHGHRALSAALLDHEVLAGFSSQLSENMHRSSVKVSPGHGVDQVGKIVT